jgi:hypothetical protein
MSKAKTLRPIATKPPLLRQKKPAGAFSRFLPHLIGMVMFTAGLILIIIATRRYIEQRVDAPVGPLNVVLLNKPAWMSDFLAQQIAATVPSATGSAFDRDLLVDATRALVANPWVRDVHQVRRAYGQRPGDTLEVDCEFRAPIALVKWGEYYWLVDGDGVKLPEQFTASHVPRIVIGRDGKLNIRIIEGVRQPPAATGEKWAGQDLAAGLGMVKLLFGKPYAEEIVAVNVSNFAGRKDPREAEIVLRTKFGSEVRWGLPLDAKDFFAEVPVAQKLDDLIAVRQQYGRVDAGQPWIDVRYDKITYPSPQASPDSAEHVDGGL